jgi:hypothetical protein
MAHIAGRLHEVQPWGGESEALPPGPDYALQIESVEQGQSPKKGTPQLNVTCIVLNEGELHGRKAIFRYNLNLEKDAPRKRLRSLVDATGVQMDDQGGFDDQQLVATAFMADVIHEPYDDVDATTGTKIQKIGVRIQNERPLDMQPAAGAAAPAAVAAAPAPAPVAAAPRAVAPAVAPRAAVPAPAAPSNARPQYAPPGRGAPLTRV